MLAIAASILAGHGIEKDERKQFLDLIDDLDLTEKQLRRLMPVFEELTNLRNTVYDLETQIHPSDGGMTND